MPASESGYDEFMKSLQTRYNDFKKKIFLSPELENSMNAKYDISMKKMDGSLNPTVS